jgi:hypothetical protein
MTTIDLELRVTALEKKIETLAAHRSPATNKDWVLQIWGSFAGDADFDKAMRYGRKWREAENRRSLRGVQGARARKRCS